MTKETRRTWAEIHLDRLAHNYHALRTRAPQSKFVGLVKANAYGHGAVPVAKELEARADAYLSEYVPRAVKVCEEVTDRLRAGKGEGK